MPNGKLIAALLTIVALVVTVVSVASCSSPSVPQRTILEQQGEIRGLTSKSFTIEAKAGDVLLIVLEQSGLDLHVQVTGHDQKTLGKYDAPTGRYGEDRVQLVAERSGPLMLSIGADRLPGVSGTWHLTVARGGTQDAAEHAFTQASRIDEKLESLRRVALLSEAMEKYSSDGRSHEAGLASLGALILLNETSSDSAAAIAHGERAIEALKKSDGPLLIAFATNALAAAQGERKQEEAMRRSFAEASRLYESAGSRIGVAEVRLFEAALDFNSADPDILVRTFREISTECARLHEAVCESLALMNTATALRNKGDYRAASELLYRSIALVDPQVDSGFYAVASENLAFLLRMIGDFDGAIQYHERAIAAYADYGECSGVSRSLYGVGYSLLGIGDDGQALRFYKLAIDRSCVATSLAKLPRAETDAMPSIRDLCDDTAKFQGRDDDDKAIASWAAWDLGNLARSVADLETAFACHDIGNRLATSDNYRLGTKLESVRDLIDLGRAEEAQMLYASVKPGLPTSSAWYRAQASDVDGLLLAAAKDAGSAVKQLAVAAKAYAEVGNFEGVYSALSRRASLGMRGGDARSDEYFVDADEALENVRLLSLDPSFSASLFASGRRIYEEWIESRLVHEARSPIEARALDTLVISERSRSRLLSQVAWVSQIGKESRSFRMRSLASTTADLLESAEAGRPAASRDVLTAETLARVDVALGLEAKRFDVKARRQLASKLRRYQNSLDADSTTIEYLLGESRSHAWVIRKDAIIRIDLANAATIRAAAIAARDALSSGASMQVTRDSLGRLNDLLMRPLSGLIRGARIAIVPDDVLHEVPFAALWDRERDSYWVETVAITYLPSLQFAESRPKRRIETAQPRALLVGDPVYEHGDALERCSRGIDPRDDEGKSRMRRLPGSGREVRAVEQVLAGAAANLTILTGCAANRTRLLASPLGGYNYLHFATHATADRIVPQRSAIYLSAFDERGDRSESAFTAADLLDHPLGAELVVMSGCSTAGGRRFGGEGSLGLSFSLIASGSRLVMSTLWPVADAASVSAMQEFYEALLSRREAAPTALRSMQLQMIASPRWNHPRNWAAYSLLGT